MKLSNEPTEWIIIHVNHALQFNKWYFMLLHINQSFKETCAARMRQIKELAKDERFYRISFWEAPYGWYKSTPALSSLMDEILDKDELWGYITLDNTDDLTDLALTEQEVSIVHLDIGTDGYASFTGLGKRTRGRFLSSEIPLDKILNH